MMFNSIYTAIGGIFLAVIALRKKKFYEPSFEYNDVIESLGMEIAELVGMISPDAPLVKSPILHRELRIRTIHSSLLIEGNQLNEEAVTAILDGKRVLGSSHDILEVENAKRAYDLLPELDPYSIDDLLLAHKTMMQDLMPDAGCFRSRNVGVFDDDTLIHMGTPATYVPEVIADLFEWLQTTGMHPLLASCVFYFEFEFCHPFADGNGRSGRLWHTLLLSKWKPMLEWLPIESTVRQRQADYYEALARSDASGSSVQFVEFMLRAIRDSLIPFSESLSKKDSMKTKAVAFFTEHPKGSISRLAEYLDCSKRSAERLVAELKAEGVLIRHGSTRAGSWSVVN